jgi:hypothetical protein
LRRDPVGRPGGVAVTLENLSSRLEDPLNGRGRATLNLTGSVARCFARSEIAGLAVGRVVI